MPTAAAIIIGDEILSGKIEETNSRRLIGFFKAMGIDFQRMVFVRDDLDVIGAEVKSCSEQFDLVITSGGLGPTHDDCTAKAIATAFGKEVVKHPKLVQLIQQHLGDQTNAAALRMANVPKGADLLETGFIPTVRFKNIYLLPGVPEIFATKMRELEYVVSKSEKKHLSALYLNCPESAIAHILQTAHDLFEKVDVGSYPKLTDPSHKLMVTVEGKDAKEVAQVVQNISEQLPQKVLLWTEVEGKKQ